MGTEKEFPLKGYSLPMSPQGKSAVIDPPPWHYGGDVLHLTFRADEKKMRGLIPPPLEAGPNPGEGVVWFTEWVSASEDRPDLSFVNPERSQYKECIVMVSCQFRGVPGYYVPYIWVDNDFTLVRGLFQGFPKKLGNIYMTRLHDMTPRVGGKKPGAKVKGICVSHAERIVEGSMVFKRKAEPSEAPPVKFYLRRHFPGIEDITRPDIHEITSSKVVDPKVADVWVGDGDVKFYGSEFEEVADLGPVEVTGAFYFGLGITIIGGEILHRYK
ncbi:MAG TPA: acetoacetate decarboxylase family protein [Syntrophorhabdaceae bacterium]|nr:acetoacetate decarboxylase family protein [Syntrophorhabdaceae bacterium]